MLVVITSVWPSRTSPKCWASRPVHQHRRYTSVCRRRQGRCRRQLNRLAVKPGHTILDVGCGQGILGRAPAHLQETLSTHRPLSAYLEACWAAGLAGCDEMWNPRRGTKGTRFAAEDLAAKETPLLLVLTAVRLH